MVAAHHYPLEGAFAVGDEPHQDAHADKRNQEGYRGEEHPPARPVGNGAPHQKAQPRELQQDEQYDNDQAGEGQ